MGSMDHYERDFEEVLLAESGGYYKRKAAEWISEDSCPEYMIKVRRHLPFQYRNTPPPERSCAF
jgi:cullin 1